MFDDRVYKRGALTVHALRLELRDHLFFELIREWTARYRHSAITTEEFVDLAGHYSVAPLRGLFAIWLGTKPLPQLPPLGGQAHQNTR